MLYERLWSKLELSTPSAIVLHAADFRKLSLINLWCMANMHQPFCYLYSNLITMHSHVCIGGHFSLNRLALHSRYTFFFLSVHAFPRKSNPLHLGQRHPIFSDDAFNGTRQHPSWTHQEWRGTNNRDTRSQELADRWMARHMDSITSYNPNEERASSVVSKL